MAKHIFKILRYEHARFLKYAWPFYNIVHERVNNLYPHFNVIFNT